MAHVVNGRDGQPKTLGVKMFAGQKVKAGNIILKQRGLKFKAGRNVGISKDYSLHALVSGTVNFTPAKVVNVVPSSK